MSKDGDAKKGTKINTRQGGSMNPLRGVTKKEAARTLKANAAGKDTDSYKTRASKRAANDHYATEADRAKRGK